MGEEHEHPTYEQYMEMGIDLDIRPRYNKTGCIGSGAICTKEHYSPTPGANVLTHVFMWPAYLWMRLGLFVFGLIPLLFGRHLHVVMIDGKARMALVKEQK